MSITPILSRPLAWSGFQHGRRVAVVAATLAPVAAELSFAPLIPGWLPRGWKLAEVQHVPGTGSMVRLRLEGPRGCWILLTERLGSTDLRTEAETVGQPFHVTDDRGVEILSFEGARVSGEPIDGWHWHRTRHVLAWQRAGVICELEQVRGRGLSYRARRRIVRRMSEGRRSSLQAHHQNDGNAT